jgi:protein-tyrosine phosphatase
MLKHVMFVNQNAAENNVGMPNWAVISITDVELKETAKIKQGWYAVHRSKFLDADLKSHLYENEVLMTEDQALEIVDYVHSIAPHVEGIIVHCRGGVSRSAAVAKWISMTFNLPFNHQYSLFNTHVYDQLIKATATVNRRPKP